ncbi:TadE/TadG family type IV pilus assembly protein [Devosia pacifica]|nr:TadE/TadG family type IV pilus assembly protein [Devosia pacifica]
MTMLIHLVRRFARDDRGVFAVIFGLCAIAIIALAGSVVDFVSMQQARNRAQIALDAATLALQPEIFRTNLTQAQIRERAQALVVERLADNRITAEIDTINVDVPNGSLFLQGTVDVPMIFVSLVGVTHMEVPIYAEATRKNLALEVVMVLDNSGSMNDQNRMTYLKQAASCATRILFYDEVNSTTCLPINGTEKKENVKIGIVPFTTMVNVGSQYANASWVDRLGLASKTRDNFDNDDNMFSTFNGPVDRIALFGRIGTSWKGCMEARDYPFSTNDAAPSAADPRTLFTPAFAVDEPDGDNSYRNSYLDDSPNSCRQMIDATCSCTVTVQRVCSWFGCWNDTVRNCSLSALGRTQSNSTCNCGNQNSGTRNCTIRVDKVELLYPRERQERLCKYNPGNVISGNGPNDGCPAARILALTTNDSSVVSAISAMEANGGTNIHQGTIWGYRALSPTAPFTEGVAYNEDATSKVMIVMTDGENTFYTANNINNARFNQAYGFPANQREGDGSSSDYSMARRMDTLLLESCTNAKNDGIKVYTIGLATGSTSNPTAIRQLLRNCSSGTDYAYFPNQPNELQDVFLSIAGQLAQLRLAQ